MKNIFLASSLFVITSFAFNFSAAQNLQLFGMTYGGGAHSSGTIFKMNDDASDFQTVYSFNSPTGKNPYGSLLQANDGKLYGMTSLGGDSGSGVLFRFDPENYAYSDVFDFNTAYGTNPYGSLIQATNGKLYGMTYRGGTKNDGVVFSFNPLNDSYAKLFDLTDSTGAFPKGDLIQASDGKLYGMTAVEGRYNYGTLFSFDPANNTFDKLINFDFDNGKFPYGSLVEAGGRLYGTTRNGGANSMGVIFSLNPADSSISKLYDFTGADEKYPSSALLLANDGKFYGMTFQGGQHNAGEVYSFDTLGNLYSTVQDFDTSNGSSPNFNTLMQASNSNLYGMTVFGGINNDGVLFSYNPADNTYAKLVDFNGSNGRYPNGTLVELKAPTGIAHANENVGLPIFPNPVANTLRINPARAGAELRIEGLVIFNVLGTKIYAGQSEIVNRKSEIQIDVSNLPAGIYFVQMKSANGSVMKKFVKE